VTGAATMAPLLSVRELSKAYPRGSNWLGGHRESFLAVDRVTFDVLPGETLGLVGESGSGKSTIGRAVTMLNPPSGGMVLFEGRDLAAISKAELREARQRLQIVFQDPFAALNPRMRVGSFVAEPLIIHGRLPERRERDEFVADLFDTVGIDPSLRSRYPHEFSGGQRQRICLARAIALRPSLIVADEPIASLDVSIQAQMINLIQDLQDRLRLSYLFISHDLRMIRHLCHRVAVLLGGRIVEIGPTRCIYDSPQHPYTRRLLSAIPIPNPQIERNRLLSPAVDLVPNPKSNLVEVEPGHFVMNITQG
jgi:peptide/nickel transport system ATP-binding protein